MLVDTSVWVDHFRNNNPTLAELLNLGEVWCHPLVIGELACGSMARRAETLSLLAALPQAPEARHEEVLLFTESHRLMARGLGWIDIHLLASTKLGNTRIWTLDKRLATVADELGISAEPDQGAG